MGQKSHIKKIIDGLVLLYRTTVSPSLKFRINNNQLQGWLWALSLLTTTQSDLVKHYKATLTVFSCYLSLKLFRTVLIIKCSLINSSRHIKTADSDGFTPIFCNIEIPSTLNFKRVLFFIFASCGIQHKASHIQGMCSTGKGLSFLWLPESRYYIT